MTFRPLTSHRGGLIARGLLAGSLFTGLGGLASAAAPEKGAMAACRVDVATFCAGIEAGGGKKMRCLSDNRSRLSPECGVAFDARLANRAARLDGAAVVAPPAAPSGAPPAAAPLRPALGACRTDMATLCASVTPGRGARVKCLMENQGKLSPNCAAAVTSVAAQQRDQRADRQQDNRIACDADAAKLCAGARGPARRQCLEVNAAQVSPACADVLARRANRGPEKQ
jgi:hypothetical protein